MLTVETLADQVDESLHDVLWVRGRAIRLLHHVCCLLSVLVCVDAIRVILLRVIDRVRVVVLYGWVLGSKVL